MTPWESSRMFGSISDIKVYYFETPYHIFGSELSTSLLLLFMTYLLQYMR